MNKSLTDSAQKPALYLKDVATYQAGIIQSRAYRALKRVMADLLAGHNLTMMQWALLGIIYDSGSKGMRVTELALELDSTKAFITNSLHLLEAAGMISRQTDQHDARSKRVSVTPFAKRLVEKIEMGLRLQLRERLYRQIRPQDLRTYMVVLLQLSRISS